MIPGEFFFEKEEIEINQGRQTVRLKVSNRGDRPVQVGSHFHFFEVNRALDFERELALGMRLNVPAGTAVRFEPGQTEEIELVAIAGAGIIHGFNSLVSGSVRDENVRKAALKRIRAFIDEKR